MRRKIYRSIIFIITSPSLIDSGKTRGRTAQQICEIYQNMKNGSLARSRLQLTRRDVLTNLSLVNHYSSMIVKPCSRLNHTNKICRVHFDTSQINKISLFVQSQKYLIVLQAPTNFGKIKRLGSPHKSNDDLGKLKVRQRRTLIAEKSLATPDWVQSLPTKGMNWPKTSDLETKKNKGSK